MNNFIKLYLLSSLSLSFINADTTKFGLGSCLDQDYPQPIWEAIEKEDLDYFVFLGDNVYGDLPSGSLRKMVSAYNCLLYTSPSPRDSMTSRMPSSA